MLLWWQRGVIYQIYPLSFQDADGDGQGDLQGIRARLDYLEWLGVDAIWISPLYPSPMKDCGYDVADYCDIAPRFGTLADFDALVADAHARDIKVILDFVPNHSSDQHPWFNESRSARDSPKRDWYIWRDPAPDGGPPNNWVSNFGGSAWTLDEATGQYYYHAFLKEQPDLNWRNPDVRAAMYDVLRFWLDRGVDGFRVDVLWHLMKDAQLRDNPPNPSYSPGDASHRRVLPVHSADQPEIFDVLAEMRRVVDAYPARVLIGEIYLPLERLVAYYGKEGTGVHLPFNFQLILAPWNAAEIVRIIEEYERLVPPGEWPNWVLGNHDQRRIATRVGAAQARVAAMLLLTLRGTPTLYYGDELGMENVAIAPEQVQDTWARSEPGVAGRDPERTPMQWDSSANAGFTRGKPWLPVGPEYERVNAAALGEDPASILTLYRRLIEMRRRRAALVSGAKRLVSAPENVIAYERIHGTERLFVALNLGAEPRELNAVEGALLLSTHLDREGERVQGTLHLRGNEGALVTIAARY
ncbi:MAG TPA: alpha-amylase family glycosyl hydrolase [Burkholderiaceae bacterium]|nr:alpha-amylase family glycosyl hydrolase [Burkholderiaceae bacterium]